MSGVLFQYFQLEVRPIDDGSYWRKGVFMHSLRYLEAYHGLLLLKELTFFFSR